MPSPTAEPPPTPSEPQHPDAAGVADDAQLQLLLSTTDLSTLPAVQHLGRGGFGTVSLVSFQGENLALKQVSTNADHGERRVWLEVHVQQLLQGSGLVVPLLRHQAPTQAGGPHLLLMRHASQGSLHSLLVALMAQSGRQARGREAWAPAAAAAPAPGAHRSASLPQQASSLMPRAQLQHVMATLIRMLRLLHLHRVVHRDLKPQNLVLDDAGGLQMIDFGAATHGDVGRWRGQEVCTPRYLPREVVRRGWDALSAASDVYAAGQTGLECCIGLLTDQGARRARRCGPPPVDDASFAQLVRDMMSRIPAVRMAVVATAEKYAFFADYDWWGPQAQLSTTGSRLTVLVDQIAAARPGMPAWEVAERAAWQMAKEQAAQVAWANEKLLQQQQAV